MSWNRDIAINLLHKGCHANKPTSAASSAVMECCYRIFTPVEACQIVVQTEGCERPQDPSHRTNHKQQQRERAQISAMRARE